MKYLFIDSKPIQMIDSTLLPLFARSKDGLNWEKPLLKRVGADRIPCEGTKELVLDTLHNRFIATVKGFSGCGVQHQGIMELGRIVYLQQGGRHAEQRKN